MSRRLRLTLNKHAVAPASLHPEPRLALQLRSSPAHRIICVSALSVARHGT